MRTVTPISTCEWIRLRSKSSNFAADLDPAVHRTGMHDQRVGLVDQGFALDHRARRHRHVDHIAAQPLAGELERGAGARRALEKAIDDRAAAQGAALVVGQSVQFDIAVGEVEKLVDVVGRQPLDPEPVAVRENGATAAPLCMSRRYRGRRPHAEGRPRPSGRQYCWMIPGDSKIAVNAHPKRIGVAAIDEPRVYQCTCRGGCLALPRSAST